MRTSNMWPDESVRRGVCGIYARLKRCNALRPVCALAEAASPQPKAGGSHFWRRRQRRTGGKRTVLPDAVETSRPPPCARAPLSSLSLSARHQSTWRSHFQALSLAREREGQRVARAHGLGGGRAVVVAPPSQLRRSSARAAQPVQLCPCCSTNAAQPVAPQPVLLSQCCSASAAQPVAAQPTLLSQCCSARQPASGVEARRKELRDAWWQPRWQPLRDPTPWREIEQVLLEREK